MRQLNQFYVTYNRKIIRLNTDTWSCNIRTCSAQTDISWRKLWYSVNYLQQSCSALCCSVSTRRTLCFKERFTIVIITITITIGGIITQKRSTCVARGTTIILIVFGHRLTPLCAATCNYSPIREAVGREQRRCWTENKRIGILQ